MRRADALPLGTRLVVLGTGQLTMLSVMHALLEAFEPEPNGFRFDAAGKVISFALATLPPLVGGVTRVPWTSTIAVAVIPALSPLLLIGVMRDPNADLNFAVFLWWFPLPLLAAAIVAVDVHVRSRRRRTTRPTG